MHQTAPIFKKKLTPSTNITEEVQAPSPDPTFQSFHGPGTRQSQGWTREFCEGEEQIFVQELPGRVPSMMTFSP